MLYLIRGLPGSGKSTLARMIRENMRFNGLACDHWEADMYFEQDGEYVFDKTKLGLAHTWCFSKFQHSLDTFTPVIVSNTFVTMEEMREYVTYARTHDVDIQLIETKGTWDSVHMVPRETLERMKRRWENVTLEV